MLDGIVKSESITNVDRLKCAILGEPGSGKSRLVTTARKPVLVYDFDDRRESIAGFPEVDIKTLVDQDAKTCSAWGTLESDIGMLEYMKGKKELTYRSVCLDSMTFLYTYAQYQMMKDASELKRSRKIGITEYFIAQGWDSINYVQRMFEGVLRRLFALDIDIYCIFHVRKEKAADSTEKEPKYTGKYTCQPQNLKMLLPMFNERWMMKDNYQVQVHQDYEFDATTALKGLNETEAPNILAMLEKHNAAISAAKK